jgi:hypothetical protein
MARKDIHRPSEINPTEYEFVCVQYVWLNGGMDALDEVDINKENREIFLAHKARTKGTFADIDHGGTCYCCGANARYVARYYHNKTNTYIDLGERCALKMDGAAENGLTALRKAISNARDYIAGKKKALAILADHGLQVAWELYESNTHAGVRQKWALRNMIDSLVRKGYLSDNQMAYLRSIVEYLQNKDDIDAKRKQELEAQKQQAAPCPTGKVEITGTVVSVKLHESGYGRSIKMVVRDDSGFCVWGTLPESLREIVGVDEDGGPRLAKKGLKIKFTATVTPSPDDSKFGFFKRPSGAEMVA